MNGRSQVSKTGSEQKARQYVIFEIGEERYAVDILRVQEIRVWEKATRLPNSPGYLKGVINLRGEIVPVLDLRERFLGIATEPGPRTVVVVLLAKVGLQEKVVGAIVDAVSDVYQISPEALQPAPKFGTAANSEIISGLAAVEGQLVILLDVDRLLEAENSSTSKNGEPTALW